MKPLSGLLKLPDRPRTGTANPGGPRLSDARLLETGDPNCPICGGIGLIKYNVPPGDERFGKILPCECRGTSERGQARLFAEAGYPDSVRDLWQTWTLDAIQGDKGKAEAHKAAQAIIGARAGLLLLWGEYGKGKTGVLIAMCNAFIRAGMSARWIRAQDLLDQISATYSNTSILTVEDVQQRYAKFAFLAVDEIEKTSGSDHAKAALFRMLDERYNRRQRQATAIATNNRELLRREQGYVMDRWTDGYQIEMTGEPMRGPEAARRGRKGGAA